MTEAEQIFEKHIGLNTELGYLPFKKEDIINAINEALTKHRNMKYTRLQEIDIIINRIKSNIEHGSNTVSETIELGNALQAYHTEKQTLLNK